MRSNGFAIRAVVTAAAVSSTMVSSGIRPAVATRPKLPERRHIQTARMALVHHVGQQITIADHGFARGHSPAGSPLRPFVVRGHVEEHFGPAIDVQVMPVEEQTAHGLAQAARCPDRGRLPPLAPPAQPIAKPLDLRRFPRAVAAVDGKEHGRC